MSSSNFGDTTGSREANRQLKVGDVWVADVRWWPQLEQARERLGTAAMPKPEGLDPVGEFWLRTEVIGDTTLVRYVLWYRETRDRGPGSGGIKIGWFILDYLPERTRRREKPVRTAGKLVTINARKRGASALPRNVRVLVDADGLPVPVPEEVWCAQFAG